MSLNVQQILLDANDSSVETRLIDVHGSNQALFVAGQPIQFEIQLTDSSSAPASLNSLSEVKVFIYPARTDRANGLPDSGDAPLIEKVAILKTLDVSPTYQITLSQNDTASFKNWPSVYIRVQGTQGANSIPFLGGWMPVRDFGGYDTSLANLKELNGNNALVRIEDDGFSFIYLDDNGVFSVKKLLDSDQINAEISALIQPALDAESNAESFRNEAEQFKDAAESAAAAAASGAFNKIFADQAAQDADTPSLEGIIGWRLDTKKVVVSTGTTLGDWDYQKNVQSSKRMFTSLVDFQTSIPQFLGEEATHPVSGVTYEGQMLTAGGWAIKDQSSLTILGGAHLRQDKVVNSCRVNNGYGMMAVVDNGFPMVWGYRHTNGVIPINTVSADAMGQFRTFSFRQNVTRNNPDFIENYVGRNDKVTHLRFNHGFAGICQTESGTVYSWHAASSWLNAIAGDGGKNFVQNYAAPIYFGAGVKIREFDAVENSGVNNHFSAIFISEDDEVYILTTNLGNFDLNAGLTGAARTPTKIINSDWVGQTIKKVRCQPTTPFFVLLGNGELYAAGRNTDGQFGRGDTTAQNQFIKIADDVDDFDVNNNYNEDNSALCILKSNGTLIGAGEGSNGWMNQGNETDQFNFVTIDSNVEKVILGSGSFISMAYLKNDGLWYFSGMDNYAASGKGDSSKVLNTREWSEVNALGASYDGIRDIVMVGYLGQGFEVCSVITGDGNAFLCGRNDGGQCGDGTTTNRTSFGKVLSSTLQTGEVFIESGHYIARSGSVIRSHVALKTNFGNVYMTGYEDYGLIGPTYRSDESRRGGNRTQFELVYSPQY